jgi:hypothetical protein
MTALATVQIFVRRLTKGGSQLKTMKSAFNNLKTIDASDLHELGVEGLHELSGFEFHDPAATPTLNSTIGLPEDRKFVQQPTARKFIDARQVESLTQTIGTLPAAGEIYHVIICGKSSLWDLVPSTLTLATPSTIRTMWIATLGFSTRNTTELLGMIDAGQVGQVQFICSHYFRATSESLYTPMHDGLVARGQKFLACRSHAKILLLELSDGRRIVAEGSANLRSCKNVEQFTLTHDSALFEFHAAWMEHLFAEASK